jgi:FHS family glucose/mannose:H+ symporter-like MFS transporter
MKRMIWMGCFLYLLIGLAHVVLGAIMPELLDYYELDYKDGGLLIFLQFFGFLIGVLIAPSCTVWLGRRQVVLMSLLSLLVGQIVYSFLPPWHWMLMAAPVAGFGFGMVEAAIGALIIGFVKDKKAVAMSKLEVFFGVGALIMPMLASYFILRDAWELSFPVIVVYTLVIAVVWMRMSFIEMDPLLDKKKLTPGEVVERMTYSRKSLPILYLMIFFFILYVGIEMSIVNFLPSIMIENNGVTKASATMSVTFFWSTMVLGRIFAGVIAEKINYSRYLLYSSFGALLFLTLFSFSTKLWISYTIILWLGLMMSGIFAIGLIFTNHVMPGMTGRTTSILVASGGIGGMLLPLLTGWFMDLYPVHMTQWLLIGLIAVMVLLVCLAIRFSLADSNENNVLGRKGI